MGLYNIFSTSKEYEKEGIVLDIGPSKWRVRRAGGSNAEFKKLLAKRVSPHKALLKQNLMPETQGNEILAGVFADTVIIGWENVTDEDDKPLEFNRDNVIKVLTELPDLFLAIQEACEDHSNFQKEIIEQETTQLKKSLNGN